MIALNLAPVRFTPGWLCDAAGAPNPGAPVFFVRPGTLIDLGQVDAELAGPPYSAGKVFPWDLVTAAEEAARALLDGDALGQVLEAFAALRAAGFDINAVPDEQKQLLKAIEPALATWPDYGELRRREARREELLPLLCAKRFLTGWDNLETPFAAGRDGFVTDAALIGVPEFQRRSVGVHAYNLMQAGVHRPLSPPPSKSGPAPKPSPAAKPRRSAAKAGK